MSEQEITTRGEGGEKSPPESTRLQENAMALSDQEIMEVYLDAYGQGSTMDIVANQMAGLRAVYRAAGPGAGGTVSPEPSEVNALEPWLTDLWIIAHRRDLPPNAQKYIERDVEKIRALLRGTASEPSDGAIDAFREECMRRGVGTRDDIRACLRAMNAWAAAPRAGDEPPKEE